MGVMDLGEDQVQRQVQKDCLFTTYVMKMNSIMKWEYD